MRGKDAAQYCFGTSPFANATPLAHFIPKEKVCPQAKMIYAAPAELVDGLLAGEADASLIPVAGLFAHPQLKMIEGLGVCACKQVQSVLLKCERPIGELRLVALDRASRTSNALAAILLKRRFGLSVEMRYMNEGETADAAVVIGDRALCLPPGRCGDYDLAGEWHALTGLPFVFAVWAYRADHPEPQELARILHAAKDAGIKAIEELIGLEAKRLGITRQRASDYFHSAIYYDVGRRELEAMALFRKWLDEESALPPRVCAGKNSG